MRKIKTIEIKVKNKRKKKNQSKGIHTLLQLQYTSHYLNINQKLYTMFGVGCDKSGES